MHFPDFRRLTVQLLALAVALSAVAPGCDSLVPAKYKEAQYTAGGVDLKAANLLSRNVTDSVGGVIPSASYLVNSRTLASVVDSALQDTLNRITLASDQVTADNRVIQLAFSGIADSLQNTALRRDSLMTVVYPSGERISYARFDVSSGDARDIYIYESLQFNQDTTSQHVYNTTNLNEYISIQLIRSDASTISSAMEMPGEVVSSSTVSVPVPGAEQVVPTIRARYAFHLDAGTYLVRFSVSSPGTLILFKVVILPV